MGHVVLVHGAMHGGWVWAPVAQRLRDSGHVVVTPTLTGMGERVHLLTREVGAATHMTDVVNSVRFEGLHGVHLVLHSYAGTLAGPLAAALRGNVSSVVVLGGFLTDPGEAAFDVLPPATVERYHALADEHGDGWRLMPSPAFLDQWGITDPALRTLVGPRLTPFPLRCNSDRLEYDPTALSDCPRLYVEHTLPPLPSTAGSVARARERGWTMAALPTSHDLMLAAPDATATLLNAWVREQAAP